MNLIDRDRLAARIDPGPERAMRLIAPDLPGRRGGQRGGAGPQFGGKGEGIGLQRQHRAIGGGDPIFIRPALGDIGEEDFPDADIGALAHRVAAVIPIVEIAHQRDGARIGRPYREMDRL